MYEVDKRINISFFLFKLESQAVFGQMIAVTISEKLQFII